MAEAAAAPLRWERKFVSAELGVRETAALIHLHPAIFREIYHARYVNSIYFDTPSWDHYHANARGLPRRVKCRIRWYGELFGPIGQPMLELKRKRGMVGSKEIHPLQSCTLDEGFGARGVLAKASLPEPLGRDLGNLLPVLITRYRRRYFLSCDGKYRLTLDSELGFQPIGPTANRFRARAREDARLIVELKFGLGDEDGAQRIGKRFPFRLSRSSKYVQGVELLYGS